MGLTSHRNNGWILVERSESGLSVPRDCGQAPKVAARALPWGLWVSQEGILLLAGGLCGPDQE